MQVYVHEGITEHSKGIKKSLLANLEQVVQNAVKPGHNEILKQMTAMKAQTMAVLQNFQTQNGNDSRHTGQGRLRLLKKTVAGQGRHCFQWLGRKSFSRPEAS